MNVRQYLVSVILASLLTVSLSETRQAAAQTGCSSVLGFQFLHQQLNGIDGDCSDNEHNDPNGSGDRVQGSMKNGAPGYMVYQLSTNTMRWTDGYQTYTYSSCGLQRRLNTQSWVWERNPSMVVGGVVPAGGCYDADGGQVAAPAPAVAPATPAVPPRPPLPDHWS